MPDPEEAETMGLLDQGTYLGSVCVSAFVCASACACLLTEFTLFIVCAWTITVAMCTSLRPWL